MDCLYAEAGGGSEKQFLKLYQHTDSMGVLPTVVFLREQPVHSRLQWRSPPHTLNIDSLASIQCLSGIRRLAQIVDQSGIDIIHTLFDDATVIGGLMKYVRPRLPVISSQRNLGYATSGIWRKTVAWGHRQSDRIIVNAAAIKAMLVAEFGVEADHIDVIENIFESRNGVSRAVPEDMPAQHAVTAVTVANLRPVKGIDDLLDAAALIAKALDIGFVVLGDAGGMSRYQQLIRSRGLQDRVHLLGYKDDPAPYLRAADIAVLPSRSEGLSNALIEYLSYGKPVVATDVGGNKEALEGGRLGLLVPPRCPERLAAAVTRLAGDAGLRADLGRKAKASADRRYSPARIVEAYRRVYSSL